MGRKGGGEKWQGWSRGQGSRCGVGEREEETLVASGEQSKLHDVNREQSKLHDVSAGVEG